MKIAGTLVKLKGYQNDRLFHTKMTVILKWWPLFDPNMTVQILSNGHFGQTKVAANRENSEEKWPIYNELKNNGHFNGA